MSNDCVFCAIAAGTGEASIVHEQDDVIAFMDIRPINDGHLLVAPKEHWATLAEVEPVTFANMAAVAQVLAGAVRATDVRSEGVNLFYADGAAAGQDVFHSHLHVIPRYAGDGLDISVQWSSLPTRDILDVQAREIATAIPKM